MASSRHRRKLGPEIGGTGRRVSAEKFFLPSPPKLKFRGGRIDLDVNSGQQTYWILRTIYLLAYSTNVFCKPAGIPDSSNWFLINHNKPSSPTGSKFP